MKFQRIYKGLSVDDEWDNVWASDTVSRNQTKLDYPEYWEIYERYLYDKSRLLEAGVGLGKWANFFHDRGQSIIGIDFSRVGIEKLKEHSPQLNVKFGDVTNIPFNNDDFDAYLSYGVLEHLENLKDLDSAISEAFRVLQYGGVGFITIPNLNFLNKLYAIKNNLIYSNLLRRLFLRRPVERHFFEYNYEPTFFKTLLERQGFTVLEIVPENVPLVLKRFKIFREPNTLVHDSKLNGFGKRVARWIVSKPSHSSIRK